MDVISTELGICIDVVDSSDLDLGRVSDHVAREGEREFVVHFAEESIASFAECLGD